MNSLKYRIVSNTIFTKCFRDKEESAEEAPEEIPEEEQEIPQLGI